MDIQEILDALNYLISDDCTDTQFDYIDEIKAAIQIVEKQVQKDVIVHNGGNHSDVFKPFFGTIKYYYCPDCHKYIEKPYAKQNYCRHCGRLIRWEP